MKASCAWGDGPDVIVSLEGTKIILYEDPHENNHFKHGIVSEGSFDLTSNEAIELAHSLLMAARVAKDLDLSYNDYVEKEKRKERIKEAGKILEQKRKDYLNDNIW